MQQADSQCHWPTLNVKRCLYAQKPYSCQAFAHESSRGGEKEKERETRKSEDRRRMERKAAPSSKELKQGLPWHSSG